MNNKIEHGRIKVVFCSKPEDKTKTICQDVVKQLEGEQVPTIIYTTNLDSKAWTKQFLLTVSTTLKDSEESLLRGLAEMPLYIGANKSYDLGLLTWLIIKDVKEHDVKKIFIESPESLNGSHPENEDYSIGVAAGTILRHLADSLNIEITLISSSSLPGDKEKVLEYPNVYIEPCGISDYVDEIVYAE